MVRRSPSLALLLVLAAACNDGATDPTLVASSALSLSRAGAGPTDPTASWLLPLNGTGLGLQSDGAFPDGGNSVYADGVCGMSGTIYATTQKSNSGDATLQTANGKCSRTFRLFYPDGVSESVQFFSNLKLVQSTASIIPVGDSVLRHLTINTASTRNSRCGTLYFGEGVAGGGVGSDPLFVKRTSASTWHVYSQPATATTAAATKASCGNTTELFSMPVDFVVQASRALPLVPTQ